MIKVGTLKRLLEKLPDDAEITAYEGEGIGLNVKAADGRTGWIETNPWNSGDHKEGTEAEEHEHHLSQFE